MDPLHRDQMEVERKKRARLRVVGFAIHEAVQIAVYLASFLPLILVLTYSRSVHPVLTIAMAVISYYLAALIFLSLLMFARKFLVGELETDQIVTVHTKLGQRFVFASMLNEMAYSSPFRSMICTLSPLAPYYFRGMGAKMASTVFISGLAKISDPWFVEIRDNATIGGGALLLAHLGDGPRIILGSIFIGEGAVVGARSVILPGVRIGRDARVGAGAVVVRNTIIPDGETWAGVPARKVIARSIAATA